MTAMLIGVLRRLREASSSAKMIATYPNHCRSRREEALISSESGLSNGDLSLLTSSPTNFRPGSKDLGKKMKHHFFGARIWIGFATATVTCFLQAQTQTATNSSHLATDFASLENIVRPVCAGR